MKNYALYTDVASAMVGKTSWDQILETHTSEEVIDCLVDHGARASARATALKNLVKAVDVWQLCRLHMMANRLSTVGRNKVDFFGIVSEALFEKAKRFNRLSKEEQAELYCKLTEAEVPLDVGATISLLSHMSMYIPWTQEILAIVKCVGEIPDAPPEDEMRMYAYTSYRFLRQFLPKTA